MTPERLEETRKTLMNALQQHEGFWTGKSLQQSLAELLEDLFPYVERNGGGLPAEFEQIILAMRSQFGEDVFTNWKVFGSLCLTPVQLEALAWRIAESGLLPPSLSVTETECRWRDITDILQYC